MGDEKHNLTYWQRARIKTLRDEMRKIAEPIGPVFFWWDCIFDLEVLLDDKETLLKQSVDEFIEDAERLFTSANKEVPK
jgi:hypothetical protein